MLSARFYGISAVRIVCTASAVRFKFFSYRSLSQCWHTNCKFNNKNTIFVLLPFPDFILWHWSGL